MLDDRTSKFIETLNELIRVCEKNDRDFDNYGPYVIELRTNLDKFDSFTDVQRYMTNKREMTKAELTLVMDRWAYLWEVSQVASKLVAIAAVEQVVRDVQTWWEEHGVPYE